MKIRKWTLLTCVATVALLSLGTPLRAETIPLTAVSGYSPVTSWVHMFKTYFMPEVDRRLLAAGGEPALHGGAARGDVLQVALEVGLAPLRRLGRAVAVVRHQQLVVGDEAAQLRDGEARRQIHGLAAAARVERRRDLVLERAAHAAFNT